MLTLALIGVVAAVACYYIINFYRWKFHVDKLTSNIPMWGYSFPIIGQGYRFLGSNEHAFTQVIDISNEANRLGGRLKFWMGPTFVIATTKPDDIRIINNTFIDKPFFYKFSALWVKNGLTAAPGVVWKKSIKRVNNAFSMSVIEGLNDIYNSYAKKIVHNLKAESGGPAFDAVSKCISFVVLEAVCHTVMGVKNIDKNMVSDDYYVAFNEVTRLLMKRASNPLVYKDFIYKMTSDYRKFRDNVKIIQGLSRRIVETKRKEIEDRKKIPSVETKDDVTGYRSLLDNFLDHAEKDPTLTDAQIQADANTFIAAGYDTTTVSAILILVMIGTYPKVQEKVYEELQEIFKGSKRDVTKEDLDKMKYCEAVVNETLRMYPVVPVVMRHADKDIELDGCIIPEGAEVIDSLWGACRSRESWGEDAEEFIPERFFREIQPADPAAFATFSYGRRMCIAKNSAMVFLKIILAQCAREFEFKADASKLKFELNIILYPIGSGHNLQVFSRN